jgi:hypothetical protein
MSLSGGIAKAKLTNHFDVVQERARIPRLRRSVMAVPTAYLTTTKNTQAILDAMQRAGVPKRFTYDFLKQLGYGSSSDRPMIPLLKALGFLDDGGNPTERYRRFKDPSLARAVLAEGLRDAYADVFAVEQQAQGKSVNELKGVFARLSDKGESVTAKMATTFKTLADRADFTAAPPTQPEPADEKQEEKEDRTPEPPPAPNGRGQGTVTMRHDVHVHLPVTTEIAVYDAIFKSLRENLL